MNTIFTIGHSTHTMEEFLHMLHSFSVQHVADIRSYPGSRKCPQFNKETLETVLPENGIDYSHLKELGGRRSVKKDSRNNRWHNAAFRGYADYMETESFVKGIALLTAIAQKQVTAFMCSEAVWWRCHRSMVSDYLKVNGWNVMHIMSATKADPHPYTAPARIVGNQVFYWDEAENKE
ncbi:MAG: DUF488 domain-containing protein [Bacteroidetes bacterium]|nr:DUF488 domain-containing protein [Bacteroidota bacterium]